MWDLTNLEAGRWGCGGSRRGEDADDGVCPYPSSPVPTASLHITNNRQAAGADADVPWCKHINVQSSEKTITPRMR